MKPGRFLVLLALVAALCLVLPASAAQTPQVPLPGGALPQFVDPLPLLSVAGGPVQTVKGNQPLTIRMCEFKARILPSTFVPPAGSTYAGYTWVWGYLPDPTGTSTCTDLIARYDVPDGSGILDTYTGPVVLNQRGTSTDVTWINDLPTAGTTNVLAWKYSTDQTLHWADPKGLNPMDPATPLPSESNMCNHMVGHMGGIPEFGSPCAQNYDGPVPAVVHLHGGEVPPQLDGGPDAWVTSDGAYKGHGYYTFPGAPANGATYKYPNTQEATPAWFHDHTLGITRLNVGAGLAGAYLIADPKLALPAGLAPFGLDNGGTFEPTVPVVMQDRRFDTNGQLFLPADTAGGLLWSPNAEHPYWVPEFDGDVIVVNGKAWPKFDVQQKRYRFLFVNGSNARTYELFLVDPVTGAAGPNLWVIATDGGYLNAPVLAKKLTMMPGERYEVIVDFAGFANPNGWLLKNTAKTPFPAGAAPQGATTAKVMLFKVSPSPAPNTAFNPAAPGATIRAPGNAIVRLPGTPGGPALVTAAGSTQNVQKVRALTLNEVMGMPSAQPIVDPVTGVPTLYPGGPLEILVNNTKWSGESPRTYDDFTPISVNGVTTAYSELPQEGDTEVWEIVNLTADAHPIHLHLVQFQLIDRQNFNVGAYNTAYNAAFPALPGDPMCTGAVYCPGFGPPLNYNPAPATGNKFGGNPDVALLAKNGKPVYLQGKPTPPNPNEAGWKDTVIVYPGQVTRLAVRWAPTDLPVKTTGNLGTLYYPFDPSAALQYGYVWHCHIIDHEDNEMMRPDVVQLNPAAPLPAARPLQQGSAY